LRLREEGSDMKKVPVVRDFALVFLRNYLIDSIAYFHRLQQRYGDIFGKRVKGVDHFFLCHPTHAEHVLSKNQDNYRKHPPFGAALAPILGTNNLLTTNDIPQWKHDRELCKTAFEADLYFEDYASKVTRRLKQAMDNWQRLYVSKQTLCPVGSELDRFAVENINETIFHNLDVDPEELTTRIPTILSLAVKKSISVTGLPWILPSRRRRNYEKAAKYMGQLKRRAVLSRLAKGKDYDDLLGTLLADYHVTEEGSAGFQQVANQTLFFNVAGYTTTTSAFRWIITILATNREVAEGVAAEARTVFSGGAPAYSEVERLPYTRGVVMETLRLHPPLAYIVRELIGDDEIDGYHLPARSSLLLNASAIHRHRDYWSDPEVFDPGRFFNKPYGQDYQYAYLPFGGGKRACIGKNFALLELIIVTAMLGGRFEFELPPGFRLTRQFIASVFVRPSLDQVLIRERR